MCVRVLLALPLEAPAAAPRAHREDLQVCSARGPVHQTRVVVKAYAGPYKDGKRHGQVSPARAPRVMYVCMHAVRIFTVYNKKNPSPDLSTAMADEARVAHILIDLPCNGNVKVEQMHSSILYVRRLC